MTTRMCRTCRHPFTPYGKARYCSTECRCGTDAGYNAGCKCRRCKDAHAANHRRLRTKTTPGVVDATGTRRRIEALACLGWSTAELSRRIGRTRSYLSKTAHRTTVHPSTAAAVARLYDELCMTWCTTPTAARTAAEARAKGWAPPLAWDEGSLDDPTATPHGHTKSTAEGFDPVVVERILAGDRVPSSRAERVEVIARWTAAGRPLNELERATGWNARRYLNTARGVSAA